MQRRLGVVELNAHLTCFLCGGYLIDATALSPCFHRFCRSCIVQYLKESKQNRQCPVCDVHIPEGKEAEYLRPDEIMQSLVYKLVPGLYQREMAARRRFYVDRPSRPEGEASGQFSSVTKYLSQEDGIGLSLDYFHGEDCGEPPENRHKLYLKCAAAVTIRHLKKLISIKYDLTNHYQVDIISEEECLPESFTLIDVAYTHKWDQTSPLALFYRITRQGPIIKPKPQPTKTVTEPPAAQSVTSSYEKLRQSEYLGHLNLNPRTQINGTFNGTSAKGASKQTSFKEEEFKRFGKDEESDSANSELRIVSEKETVDASSEDEYRPKKRKKHENLKKAHPQKRRKSDSFGDLLRRKALEDKKRRKSLFEPREDGTVLKNEALKKVFVYKEKPDTVLRKKDDLLKKKKRKKSKHHEGEFKKRKIDEYAAPSILSVDKDSLKLKVKLPVVNKHSKLNGLDEKVDKERLLHLRSVRHKNVSKKEILSSHPSLTISKVGGGSPSVGKTSLVETKPSLEIMLVKKSDTAEPAALDLSEKAKVLDLSNKSPVVPKKSPVEKAGNKTTQQSILQIAETLVNRKLSPTPDTKSQEPSMAVVAMRDLKTLSDAAVNILMAAQSQQKSEQKFPKREENGLKIPVFPRERIPVPPVPNLHEIFPRGRGRPPVFPPRPIIKPNQTVRHIPDPSAVLNRQNRQLSRPDSSTSPGKPKDVPPLHSIKKPLIVDRKEPAKMVMSKPVVSSTSILPRRPEMAKNIESVAAGLTARATALIDAK